MDKVIVEKLKRKDAPALNVAYLKSLKEDFNYYPPKATEKFKAIWNEKYFRGNRRILVVAKVGNEVVGFLIGRQQWEGTGLGTIEWFWVDKKYRKQGLGRQIIKKAEELYLKTGHHKINLEADNPKTWDIYLKYGFEKEGFEKNHAWHHDEYIYGKVLS